MRKVLAIVLVSMLLFTTAGASSFGLDTTNLFRDALVEHRVFLVEDTEDYAAVITVFYGCDTHRIFQYNYEVLFDKRVGYTVNDFLNCNPEEIFPGFNRMSCASYSVEEGLNTINVLFSFFRLNDPENFRQMVDSGILSGANDTDYVDLNPLFRWIESTGGRELSMLEYGQVGLHFDLK